MRAKSTDLQDNSRSEAPSCAHCGLPLLAEARYCPFCERKVARISPHGGRIILGVSERTLLLIAAGVLALGAVVSLLAAAFA